MFARFLFLPNHPVTFIQNHTVIDLYFVLTEKMATYCHKSLISVFLFLSAPIYRTYYRTILYILLIDSLYHIPLDLLNFPFKRGSSTDWLRFPLSPPLSDTSWMELYCYTSPLLISFKGTAEFLLLFISLFSAIYCYSSLFPIRKQHLRNRFYIAGSAVLKICLCKGEMK